MSKENGQEFMSFTENNQRWLQCKVCYDYIKADEDAHAITCSSCTMKKALAIKPIDTFFAKNVSNGFSSKVLLRTQSEQVIAAVPSSILQYSD